MKHHLVGNHKRRTRADLEEYMNVNSPPINSAMWIIGGKLRLRKNYGKQVRRHEPEKFESIYLEWSKHKLSK